MFAGHQHRGELHVVSQVRALDGVTEPNLDDWRLQVRLLAGGPIDDGGGGMVAQVFAHPRQVLNNRDSQAFQVGGRADARQHQKLG